jgi:hypothetical protein
MNMNEIGGSKAHSNDAGGSAQTRSRSDRNVMQRQAPGYYRYRVGEIVVTVVTDGERNAPLDDKFVLNATREEVASALRSSFLPSDRLITFFNPVVLHTESKLVLIDTGFGQGAFHQTQPMLVIKKSPAESLPYRPPVTPSGIPRSWSPQAASKCSFRATWLPIPHYSSPIPAGTRLSIRMPKPRSAQDAAYTTCSWRTA